MIKIRRIYVEKLKFPGVNEAIDINDVNIDN